MHPSPQGGAKCLGSLGIFGTDPKNLTHLVPCGAQGPPVASRWVYDKATQQLRYDGVSGQPRPSNPTTCLATPTMTDPQTKQQLDTVPCANGGRGWVIGADGVLSVPGPAGTDLDLCMNVWRCQTEVVYYPCKPLGTGTCGGSNEKWMLRADGELQSGMPTSPSSCGPSTWQVGFSRSGGNLAKSKTDGAAACCAACSADATCASWLFDSSNPTAQAKCQFHDATAKAKKEDGRISGTARPTPPAQSLQVWHRPLASGEVAVALLNRGGSPQNISFTFEQVGLGGTSAAVRDVWAGGPAVTAGRFELPVDPHAAEVFVLTKTA